MKHILRLLLFLSTLSLFGQQRGEVFKRRPERPYEDIKKTGKITVTKTLYGLDFEDRHLPKDAKIKAQTFFKKRYNGYTDLKTYHLRIEDTPKGWRIEGYLIQ
ncbi:hypothetical protein [Riemerella anatipestifer]|uniref:hypothetical protein n=1 Tax=Riemerella anatipestifer TaxID=34085 RepID=UPI0009A16E46|nr:hypothetical protein [Riemerella anatipestifer]MBT0556832.1 hypothetical protein [Riemerella anatipestifer]MCO7355755.1 hypothetical protein [Riemerella anatipestifer]MDY3525062.1 hypothetical protein [Riemerella anatipestifer]NAV17202.1 hypothetical protein [Riemerella anatipestifer]UZX27753.1 hypothetical protein OIS45_10380 [Riemerella anatipestifer]